jgi:glycosyltransferase involved in cell wall biosynthesis
VVTTHPIQYYAPWFRHLASRDDLELRVFYLWDFGVTERRDPGFGRHLTWDIPLLDGYPHEFVANRAARPGTDHFLGLHNPDLDAALARFAPDAVLLMSYSHRSTLRQLLRRRWPLLMRGDSHGLAGGAGGWRLRLKAWLFRRFAAVLYVGSANRAFWRAHGVPESRLFFSPHAIDNQRFVAARASADAEAATLRAELGIAADATVALFVGKLEAKKRPLDLIAAFRAARVPDAHLVLVGDGALAAEVDAACAAEPRIHRIGFTNQSRMPGIYALGDLLVLPSFGAWETWGLAVNEAFCLARPALVSSHVGCHPDLITDGETGWVFAAGDVDALTRRLGAALADRGRLATMGRAAARRIAQFDYAAASSGLMAALAAIGARR